MKIGVVVPLPQEAKTLTNKKLPFQEPVEIREGLWAIRCGVGHKKARKAAQLLVSKGAQRLISWGTAGALISELTPGTLLLPEKVVSMDGETVFTDAEWRINLESQILKMIKARNETLLQSDRILNERSEKDQVYRTSKAIAVDMESLAVGKVAFENHVPFLVIRSIIDSIDTQIPQSVISSTKKDGSLNMPLFLSKLAFNPKEWKKISQMNKAFNETKKTLGVCSQLI